MTESARDDRSRAHHLMVEARANVIYHTRMRSLWGLSDVALKIALAAISTLASAPVAFPEAFGEHTAQFGWAGLISAMLGAVVVAVRVDVRVAMHAKLAVEYLGHLQEFQEMFHENEYKGLTRAWRAYSKTEEREATKEGGPCQRVFAAAEAQARRELDYHGEQ